MIKCEPVLGYLHRGDEKIAENMTYNQFVPYTDRLDYLAPLLTMLPTHYGRKLADLEIPPNAVKPSESWFVKWLEYQAIFLGMGVFGMDAGAWTPFMYTFTEREKLVHPCLRS